MMADQPLRYLSLFSGIGGMDLGFDRASMVCAGQVEFDAKARSVLARHWPDVPRMADVKEVQGDEFGTIDLICGGFPCQDVSVAGRRKGLAGERSGLWYEFHRIVDRVRPRWAIAENVPGLLSSNGGRDFAVVLRGLVECGYGVAWRILDAQYFGVPQRRRRVFIVASLGSGRAAEVLFEREGGGGHSQTSRGPRPGITRDVAATLNSGGNSGGFRTEPGEHLLAVPLRTEGHDASEDGTGRQTLVFDWQSGGDVRHNVSDRHTSALQASQTPAVAFTERTRPDGVTLEMQEELAYALTNPGAGSRTTSRNIAGAFGVRRLTPVECERLQGFPDNWSAYGADGPQKDSSRYRQLGNAVAVPVAEWVSNSIVAAETEARKTHKRGRA